MKLALTAAFLMLAYPALAQETGNPLEPSETWDVDLRESVLGLDAEPPIDPALLDLAAPVRADDAALVPLRITQPEGAPALDAVTVVIDQNPAPVAAEFQLGQAMAPLDFEIRVRVDAYSDVRVIGNPEGDAPVMAGRFIKASGGCSAPAGKDMAAVADTMGEMRWKTAAEGDRNIGTLMIRHPNFSGLQRDQVTLLTIPAHFIDTLEVRQGEDLLFTMSAGISISEDPVFRFAYEPNGQPISVHAEDTDGNSWDQTFDAAG